MAPQPTHLRHPHEKILRQLAAASHTELFAVVSAVAAGLPLPHPWEQRDPGFALKVAGLSLTQRLWLIGELTGTHLTELVATFPAEGTALAAADDGSGDGGDIYSTPCKDCPYPDRWFAEWYREWYCGPLGYNCPGF